MNLALNKDNELSYLIRFTFHLSLQMKFKLITFFTLGDLRCLQLMKGQPDTELSNL